MKRELALEFSRITEAAALASSVYVGCGDKNIADNAAVEAMRNTLNDIEINGEVVIGEGEIDEAPMLYIGEKVGKGGIDIDIAVDPIDGTRMVALGQENAVSVMVLAKKGSLLKAPDMYMEKIMVNQDGYGAVDLSKSITDNIKSLSVALKKPISEIKVMTLAKPRHEKVITDIQSMGAKVIAIPDGDVAGSVLVAVPGSDIDMFYGIGGAPEGVISAAIMRAMEGDMQARLMTRSQCKGFTEENNLHSEMELKKLKKLDLNTSSILKMDDLCNDDNLIVTITGITDGSLLKGCTINNHIATTHTMLIRGKTRTIRKIESIHDLRHKDIKLLKLMKKEMYANN